MFDKLNPSEKEELKETILYGLCVLAAIGAVSIVVGLILLVKHTV